MPLIYSRPDKLNHADTILYEIYMLRFAAIRLIERQVSKDAWVYLEAFLIHYRNLIEFLGKQKPRPDDLHVMTIWQLTNLTPPATLKQIHADGTKLWNQYEPTDAQGDGRISQYLQHCTMKRIDMKVWLIDTMTEQIEPLLTEVEKHLKPGAENELITPVPAVKFRESLSASTAISTSTAVAALDSKKRLIG